MKFRFTNIDRCGNVRYLVVTKNDVYLTNPSQTPLALSNEFRNAARLSFALEDEMESGAPVVSTLLDIINREASNPGWVLL